MVSVRPPAFKACLLLGDTEAVLLPWVTQGQEQQSQITSPDPPEVALVNGGLWG